MKSMLSAVVVALWLTSGVYAKNSTPWGKDYFPNTSLITQDGENVRFFDDLIEGKIVVINFIYTTCGDTCPLETAKLVKVQEILGDRVGEDIFFYSITLDPESDTPEILKQYKERYRASWMFLTGDEEEIFDLQKKLGLFLEEARDDLSNHNVTMIIGNQATGRWMKRAPFENPYVLADHIGNWLDGWRRPPQLDSYLNAPKLREVSRGEQMFRTRCASCHTLTGHEMEFALGPDLLGVTESRDPDWLMNWLRAPDQMLKDKDPIAIALYEKYNKLAMPNLRINQEEASDILAYIAQETGRIVEQNPDAARHVATDVSINPGNEVVSEPEPSAEVVTILNPWIRNAHPAAKVNYGFMGLANPGSEEVVLTDLRSKTFENVAIKEVRQVEGAMRRQSIAQLVIPPGGQVELKPGGMHLMLSGSRDVAREGDQVELTLMFKSGSRQTINVDFSDQPPAEKSCPGCPSG